MLSGHGRRRGRPWPAPGVTAGLAFAALAGLWSVITPLYGAPDEPAHIIRAESVVRGQLLGEERRGTGSLLVSVPAFLATSDRRACYSFHADMPASCMHLGGAGHGTRRLLTSAGRHPPWYYAVVGVPSLVVPGTAGVRLIRLLSALLCAALVALAFDTARRHLAGTLATAGLAVAATPMLFFLAGTVNPSGLEIAAAVSTWMAAIAIAGRATSAIPPGLIPRLGISAAVLILCRHLGLLWVAIIGLLMLVVGGWRLALRLWHDRRARAWLVALVVVTGAQLTWVLSTGTLTTEDPHAHGIHGLSLLGRLRGSFGATYPRFLEMLGIFGWLDTPSPTATYFLWTLALGGIVTGLYLVGRRPAVVALVLTAIAVVVIPTLIEAPAAPTLGYFWQGRYTLPIAVGIPILAGALIRPGVTWRLRRAGGAGAVVLGLASLLAFMQFWRRNAVGIHGPLVFLSKESWTAPLPAALILPAAVLATGAWKALLLIAPGRPRPDTASGGPADHGPGPPPAAARSRPTASMEG